MGFTQARSNTNGREGSTKVGCSFVELLVRYRRRLAVDNDSVRSHVGGCAVVFVLLMHAGFHGIIKTKLRYVRTTGCVRDETIFFRRNQISASDDQMEATLNKASRESQTGDDLPRRYLPYLRTKLA